MLDFLKNHWDECLSVLAIIVALVPLLVELIKRKCRKIYANIVDYNIITNAEVCNCYYTEKKTGTLLLLAINLFVPYESFFVENYEINAKLKSGTVSKAIITDGGITIHRNDGKDTEFIIPSDYNFNLHKEIICEQDNIRIFEIMLLDATVDTILDIDSIEFIFKNSKSKKIVTIGTEHFPKFNKMQFLSEFDKDVTIFWF